MALQKEKRTRQGIITNYHNILRLNIEVNDSNSIEVRSYISKEDRELDKRINEIQTRGFETEEEVNALSQEEKDMLFGVINVYKEINNYILPYDENMNIKNAYEYLKTLDDFKDAKDV